MREPWLHWRSELNVLSSVQVSRCYYPKDKQLTSLQLHGFGDASKLAFMTVVYLCVIVFTEEVCLTCCIQDMSSTYQATNNTTTGIVWSRFVGRAASQIQGVFGIPSDCLFAWTDSTIMLAWLVGNPNRFKTYVANRISQIVELVAPKHWHQLDGVENPADCA